MDLISKKATIDKINERQRKLIYCFGLENDMVKIMDIAKSIVIAIPSAEPKIVRCCKCGFWDRDTLKHQFNDFRDWNEAECKILAERDPYHEINRYTEADDFCSYAERRTDE